MEGPIVMYVIIIFLSIVYSGNLCAQNNQDGACFFNNTTQKDKSSDSGLFRSPMSLQAIILDYYGTEEGSEKLIKQCLSECHDLTQIPPTEILVLFNLLREENKASSKIKTKLLAVYPALWALTANKKALKGHLARVNKTAFFPEKKLLITGSDDATVIVWDTSQHKKIAQVTLDPSDRITACIPTKNDHILIGTGTGKLILFDYREQKNIYYQHLFSGPIIEICSLDKVNLTAILFGDWLMFFDPEDLRWLNEYEMADNPSEDDEGPLLLGLARSGGYYLNDRSTGSLVYGDKIDLIASSEKDNSLAFILFIDSCHTEKTTRPAHKAPIAQLAFSPDNML